MGQQFRQQHREQFSPQTGLKFRQSSWPAPPPRNNPRPTEAEFVPSRDGAREIGTVNLCGYLRTESGVGAAVRGYASALDALALPVAYVDLSAISGNRAHDTTLAQAKAGECAVVPRSPARRPSDGSAPPIDINLVCVDVELHYAMWAQLGEAFFEGKYNIGIWWWELPNFPQKWLDRFAFYDEIWTGSSFVAHSLATVSPLPVVRIPPVLAPRQQGSRMRGRYRLGIGSDEVVYLFIFDFHSHMARKNPLGLVEAFRRAFSTQAFAPYREGCRPVRLILKCVNADSDPAGYGRLQQAIAAAGGEEQILLYDGYWPAQEIQDLMAACDVYVSLHRSEGAGLTIADAMAYGKPVIATGWSGNMDFMDAANSFPVDYKLVEIAENVGPYRAGEQWAEPCLDHAAELMRAAYADLPAAQQRGQRGQAHIQEEYTVQPVARRIAQRLEAIQLRCRFSTFRKAVRAQFREYQGLPQRLQTLVARTVTAGTTLLVISKGDPQLLELENWTAWHFPQGEDGAYAGYHPADSQEAIDQLETLRARGAGCLVVPHTAYWWFEHYTEFKRYLDQYCLPIGEEDEVGMIFALQGVDVILPLADTQAPNEQEPDTQEPIKHESMEQEGVTN